MPKMFNITSSFKKEFSSKVFSFHAIVSNYVVVFVIKIGFSSDSSLLELLELDELELELLELDELEPESFSWECFNLISRNFDWPKFTRAKITNNVIFMFLELLL